jgi:calcium-translocating P-type ATPase
VKIHLLDGDAALASLQSGPAGLSHAEARRRLGEYGPNRLEEIKREHLLLRFAREFSHFFALILWLAAGLAFLAERHDPGAGMDVLGWAIIGVIVINGGFSFWQEYRAERAIQALRRLLPHRVQVLRADRTETIEARELVPGDILFVNEGDSVPADCRLLEAFGVRVNNATVTGESVPRVRDAQPVDGGDLIDARNVLLAGTSVVSGEGQAVVFATGARTEFGRIAHLTQTAGEATSPLQREITRLSRILALVALAVGVVFFLVGQWLGLTPLVSFMFGVGILVALVPEGLLPTVTLALAMGAQRMARRNALIRHLPAVETLGSATVIVTDKTGTLTRNRMVLRRVFHAGGEMGHEEFSTAGTVLAPLWQALVHCHNLKPADHGWIGDPMEVALMEAAVPLAKGRGTRLDELAFEAERRRMSVLAAEGGKRRLYTKGAPETVLPLCDRVLTPQGVVPLDAERRRHFLAGQEALARQGLRVLAVAWREVGAGEERAHWESGLVLLALTALEDPPRPEVPLAIAQCAEAGVRVIMVTGDHPRTALAVAQEIGLARGGQAVVVTGEQLGHWSDTQLQLALDQEGILFARAAADQKLRIVAALRRKGEVVAVTGDGVNDAPALRHADIGIAMGASGTDVAREAADMVLLDDNFASIVSAIEEGRAVYDNLRKFMTYILTSNIPEVVPYLAFVLFRIPLPLTVIQILAVGLGTDMLPALALGAEKPEPGAMSKPPRPRGERLLSWPLLARAYLFLGVMEAAAAMAAFFFVLHQGGWQYAQPLAADAALYLQATTACLTAIIVMQVANVFLCRSATRPFWRFGLFANPLILWGVGAETLLILLIGYTPWGNTLFGTAPVGLEVWLFLLPFALVMIVGEETRKWQVRRVQDKMPS